MNNPCERPFGNNNSVESRQKWNSARMSRIRSVNTRPEMLVRSALHRSGLRFRVHQKDLPGSPDLVFRKFQAVVFVNGCFWHRHRGCSKAQTPRTARRYWEQKFEANRSRDDRNYRALRRMGWHVLVVWECQISRVRLATLAQTIRRGARRTHPTLIQFPR